MDRRESLKTLLVGSLAGSAALATGCVSEGPSDSPDVQSDVQGGYGRTASEIAHDERLLAQQNLTEHELETIAVLCDLILPGRGSSGSASDAGVPDFIEFISKDITALKLPIRGGVMWIDHRSNEKFNLAFKSCSRDQHTELLDEIAFPERAAPELAQGVNFFSLMRNLTLTGYYTTRMGFDDLGYVGNSPNVWDGVPDEVMKKYGISLDPKYKDQYVDQSKRNETASWDENGNLIQ